jgi:D-glycero-D-manno-heptose 1,7-bisphosphate phosphatase
MSRQALFIDRDGTLVHARHYPTRPEELVLYDGVGGALATLQRAGLMLVVITNQSGLARGLFDVAALDRMHEHLAAQLARDGVRIDALYYCPHHPEGVIPGLAAACDCRKPAPGMLLRAAAEHDIDLARSWFVGDILDDVEAGNRASCRTVLVDIGSEQPPALPARTPTYVARDTLPALALSAAHAGVGPSADTTYRPERWQATAR